MHRPDGFQLVVSDDAAVLGRGAEAPGQRTVGGAEAVDVSVGAAEQRLPGSNGRRAVHAAAGGVAPRARAVLGVEGVNRVAVNLRHEHLAPGDRHAAELAAEAGLPRRLHVGRHGRLGAAAPRGIVPVRRPLRLRIADCGLRITDRAVRRAFLQPRVVRLGGDRLALRRQRVEAVQLALNVAGARVRRRIEQSVARDDAVLAGAADPVVWDAIARGQFDELDPRPAEHEIPVGCFVAVAAMMAHTDAEELLVRGTPPPDFARGGVAAFGDPRLVRTHHVPRPHQAARHQDVDRCVVDLAARAAPQLLAILHRVRNQLTGRRVAAFAGRRPADPARVRSIGLGWIGLGPVGGQHHVAVHDQRGCGPAEPADANGPGGPPLLLARLRVEADDLLGILEEHAPARDGEGRGHQVHGVGAGLRPQQLPGLRTDRGEALRRLDQRVTAPPVPPRRAQPPALGGVADDHEQQVALADDLARVLGPLVRLDRPARRGVEGDNRLAVAERDVDAVLHGDEPSRQAGRAAAETAQVLLPRPHRPLPQGNPVERVPRHKRPLGRQGDGRDGPLIHDVEDAAAGRDDDADAGEMVVASRPFRRADPLEMLRRPDDGVAGHGVVARVVQVMSPFVDVGGPRLDRLCPLAVLLDVRHAVGAQDAHHFVHRDGAQVLRDEQVDEVVGVGQAFAAPRLDGDVAVQAERADVHACLFDVGGVGVETVDEITVVRPQRGRQPAVAAADVNDEPALDPGRRQDRLGLGLRGGLAGVCRAATRQHRSDNAQAEDGQTDRSRGSRHVPTPQSQETWITSPDR